MSVTRICGIGGLVWLLAVAAWAQPAADPRKPAAKEEPVAAARQSSQPDAAEGDTRDEQPLREQTIYVPYSRLRRIFEQPGRGVFLPYEEFQTLWQKARAAELRPPADKPPLATVITDIENEASVAEEVVNVTAKLKLEILAPGWHQVPLRLADAAILSAKLGDQPARLIADPKIGHTLLIEKKGKQPEQLLLTLEYAKAFTKSPGQNTVSFQAPQSPVNRWRIRIPQSGVKVNVQPLIAATQEPAAGPPAEAKETVVLAFVGAAPSVQIDWTPKAEGATGLEALATVQADHQVTIDEGVVRTRVQLAYKISRAELTKLELEAPADHKVLNVFDANVKEWKVSAKEKENVHTITVQLYEPARTAQNLTVELEQFGEDIAKKPVTAPVVKALGVGQQQGALVVRAAGSLRAEATQRAGLLQLDAGELPPALANQAWNFSFRYAALPWTLGLRVEKVQPEIRTRELVEAYLEPERLTLDLLALYEIDRAGVFQLELDLAAGFEVRQVQGRAAAEAQAVTVDAYHLEGEQKTKLIVNLSRKALGKVGLFVELQRRLEDPNLLTPTGRSSTFAVPIPRVAPAGIERSVGRLIVYAPESLRVNPTKQDGLQVLSVADALEGTASTRGGRFGTAREVQAYGYGREPVDLALAVERRKPQITVRQLLLAQIESGVVKYEATFFYEVRYSSVKSLRLDVPAALATELRNQSTAVVREAPLDPPPKDVAEGYVAWSLTGETELLGDLTIKFAWEQKIAELELGKGIDLELPRLQPRTEDRAWGQIVLAKAENLEVRPTGEPKNLRPIDPQRDLMAGVRVDDAARAFQFQADDWKLTVTATRYQLEEVKRTSIERAVVRIEVTRSHVHSVQALYRVRSARQRLAVLLPKDVAFDTSPLRIDGRPVSLERGDQAELYVPLVGQKPDKPFLLELRYTVPGDHARLDLPEFPEDPAVQKVFLCAYLPRELKLLGARGPWTDESGWPWFEHFVGESPSQQTDEQLVAWVLEGLEAPNPFKDFATDGRRYTFSTLRPAPAPGGSLRLVAWHRWLFNALVFVLVVAVAVGVLRRPLSHKFAALVLLVMVLVLAGVFAPTFSQQLLGGALLSAVLVVLALWLAWYAVTLWRPVAAAVAAWSRRKPAEPTSTAAPAAPAESAAPAPADTGGASPFQPAPETPASPTQEGGRSHE
jgi:hypothetical protein